MHSVGYFLARSIVRLLSILPDRMLYAISDLLSWILCCLVRYRRGVVLSNLEKAFPEYPPEKVRKTARNFYGHLTDLLLESAVSTFYPDERFLKRIRLADPGLLNRLHREGKHVVAVTGHYGNWELLSSMSWYTPYRMLGIYKPLRNRYYDRWIRRIRARFDCLPVPMDRTARELIRHRKEGRLSLTVLLSDQRPVFSQIQHWTTFLGQKTPVYLGPEKLARKFEMAVVFLKCRKVRRGYYEVGTELICENAAELPGGEITEAHVRILESLVREKPEYWLWSHRRWKHSYERWEKERGPH